MSQWSDHDFEVDGDHYKTAEHFMMGEKARLFGDEETRAKILASNHPGDAKKLGRQVRGFKEPLWTERRVEIVVRGNVAKFGQNPELKAYLLGTGERILVEASPKDKIWGIGLAAKDDGADDPKRWKGLNLLGLCVDPGPSSAQRLKASARKDDQRVRVGKAVWHRGDGVHRRVDDLAGRIHRAPLPVAEVRVRHHQPACVRGAAAPGCVDVPVSGGAPQNAEVTPVVVLPVGIGRKISPRTLGPFDQVQTSSGSRLPVVSKCRVRTATVPVMTSRRASVKAGQIRLMNGLA